MPDPQTPAKGLTQPQVGGDNNSWGGLLNTDLGLIDSALGGTIGISISGNLILNNTQNSGYVFTGTLSGTATITWPNYAGMAAIQNATTGGFSIICKISGGAAVTVLSGETVAVWSDGTNFARLAQVGGGSGTIPNSALSNSSITIAGHMVSLGGTQALVAADLSNGTTGGGNVVLATSPTIASPTFSGTASGTVTWAGDQYFKSGRPWADVRAFGAVGDGHTDDTAAFNAAIASLTALTPIGAGILFVPPGYYALNSGITITGYTTIVGCGPGASILTANGHDVTVVTLDGLYASMRDIRIFGYGSSTDPSGGVEPVIWIKENTVNGRLYNVFSNWGAPCLRNDGTNNVIRDCQFLQSYAGEIVLDTSGFNVYENCIFDQSWPVSLPSFTGTSIPAWPATTAVTAGNVYQLPGGSVIQCSRSGTTGGSAPSVPVYNVAVTDGSAQWLLVMPVVAYSALYLDGSPIEHVIHGCDFSGSTYSALHIVGPCEGLKISKCTFSQTVSSAILIETGTHTIIDGNEIFGGLLTDGIGVQILSTASGVMITGGNRFQGGAFGVLIQGASEVCIANNRFANCTIACVANDSAVSGLVVEGNIIYTSNTGSVILGAFANDYYNIVNNIVHGIAVNDNTTGSPHRTVSGNN